MINPAACARLQAASGAGAEGMEELQRGIEEHVRGDKPGHKVFAHPLPFNVIPHIDKFQNNRYTKEEMKVAWETRKIFHAADVAVSCTAVRVPTLRAHAEAITIECVRPITPDDAASVLVDAPGVELVDNPKYAQYPMPLNASSKSDVEVGRLRQSLVFGAHGLDLFVCGDQVRTLTSRHDQGSAFSRLRVAQLLRGAALNAVLIAKLVTAPSKTPLPPMPRPPVAKRQAKQNAVLAVTVRLLMENPLPFSCLTIPRADGPRTPRGLGFLHAPRRAWHWLEAHAGEGGRFPRRHPHGRRPRAPCRLRSPLPSSFRAPPGFPG